jgi:putative membrane protein
MPRQRWEQRSDGVALNVIGGLLGGLVAGFAMERFQRALGRISADIGGAPGAGGQQYRKPQSEPASYKAADALARAATGESLSPENKPAASAAIHYAFAGAVGAIYGAAATRTPDITAWGGVPFGATVWLIADEMGMPVAGLAKPPSEYPLQDHAATLTSHLIYGATTEAVRRCVVATLRR